MLILSSETYDQKAELFLPRKPFFISPLLLLTPRGSMIEFLRRLPKAVRFHVDFIKFFTFVADFLGP